MRLSAYEIKTIKETVGQYDSNAEVYLFGSRTDDSAKGGDIDLLVLSKNINFEGKILLQIDLKDRLGNHRIDLLLKKTIDTAFARMAKYEGILLD
jgi:predicted nucleotidyltransferase